MMKLRNRLSLFSAAVLLALTGCSKDETEGPISVPDRNELNQNLYADQTGGGISFTAQSDWHATVKENGTKAGSGWIDIEPKSGGAGSATIRISLEPNLSGKERSATVTISCEGSETVVSVSQKAQNESGTVPGLYYQVDGGEWSTSLPSDATTIVVESRGGNFPLTEEILRTIAGLDPRSVDLGKTTYRSGEFPDFFRNKHVEAIVLPINTETLAKGAFFGCAALKDVTLPKGLREIGPNAFSSTGIEEIGLPSDLVSIGESAFAQSLLRQISLPTSSPLIVGERAFSACESLEAVDFGHAAKCIGSAAFEGCVSLRSVTLPSSVDSVGEGAFERCAALKEVRLGDGLREVGRRMFADCPLLSEVALGDGTTRIGENAFLDCKSLQAVTLPQGLLSIGDNAFSHCDLRSIVFPESLEELGSALDGCVNLRDVVFETDKLRSIPFGLFQGNTAMEHIELPESIETIGSMAFYGCKKLDWISMGSRLKSIGEQAFTGCSMLNGIICHAQTPPSLVGEIVFADAGALFPGGKGCYVPAGSVEAYRTDVGWQRLESIQGFSFRAISMD